jgi:hypothetical protein
VCEILAVAFDEPRPFGPLARPLATLEEYGLGGFGWGVAWLDDDLTVKGLKRLGRFREEAVGDGRLMAQRSRRFLVHLRRPSRLSTVQMADTQPFFAPGGGAWCHNGFLDRAEEMRPRYAERLRGRADSEVGWQYFCDRQAEGDDTASALVAVDRTFGGKVNLGYLAPGGELTVYSRNSENHMWTFCLAGGDMATSALHSDDTSVFDLAYPEATDRQRLEPGSVGVVGHDLHQPVAAGNVSAPSSSDGREGAK